MSRASVAIRLEMAGTALLIPIKAHGLQSSERDATIKRDSAVGRGCDLSNGPEHAESAEARAQRHVDDQKEVVRRLKAEGRDSRPAERLLETLRAILRTIRRGRLTGDRGAAEPARDKRLQR
jgi:hypothetical protein